MLTIICCEAYMIYIEFFFYGSESMSTLLVIS